MDQKFPGMEGRLAGPFREMMAVMHPTRVAETTTYLCDAGILSLLLRSPQAGAQALFQGLIDSLRVAQFFHHGLFLFR